MWRDRSPIEPERRRPCPHLQSTRPVAPGYRAIILAAQQVALGRAAVVLAGGTESMSRVPYFAEGALGHAYGKHRTSGRYVSRWL